MTNTFSGFDALIAIVDHYARHSQTITLEAREQIRDSIAGTNPTAMVLTTLECLYSTRDENTVTETVELMRDLGAYADSANLRGYGANGRAQAIVSVCERILNNGVAVDLSDPD